MIRDHVVTYDSATNTLSGASKQIGGGVSRAALFDPAYHAALTLLYPREAAVGKHLPGSFSQLIVKLIRSPDVSSSRLESRWRSIGMCACAASGARPMRAC